MIETRISTKTIVNSQIPLFMQEEYPLLGPFLKQYYESQDFFSSPIDIAKNIDQYKKVNSYSFLTNNLGISTVTQFVDLTDETIYVSNTFGWPVKYGLLKINDEIITYTGIGSTSFNGCIRGFSGITTYNFNGKNVSYETTTNDTHGIGSTVYNLSNLFLKEFFKKTKYQFLPGFEDLSFFKEVNQKNILLQGKDFYSTKGTPAANNILFKSLYGEEVETINPQQYLLKPSNNDYRLVKQVVVEAIDGDPLKLEEKSIYQEVASSTGITTSYGSISAVEPTFYNGKQYYTLDVDFGYDRDIQVFGTIFGDIKIHPNTKVVGITSSTILVDSTIGFPKKGVILINELVIEYQNKTNNEFIDCNNIDFESISIGDDVVSLDYQTYGYDEDNSLISVRVTGILEKLNISSETYNYYVSGDPILVKSLGLIKDKNDFKFNSWKFNNLLRLDLKSIEYNGQYFVVTTFGDHQLSLFDEIEFVDKINGDSFGGRVERIVSDQKIQISSNLSTTQLNLDLVYFLRRKIKISSPPVTKTHYLTDIQNVYDSNGDVVVTSPSLPSYQIESTSRSISYTISGFTTTTELFIPNHNFYSGDYVTLTSSSSSLNLKSKNYFVKKVDNNIIKLSLSNSNISNEIYETFENFSENSISISIEPFNNAGKQLSSQKIVREIKLPEISKNNNIETTPGKKLGILINGVEILNYKGQESVFYGPIESISVLDGGEDYDILNPPVVEIQDSQGIGATATCSIIGNLKEIKILDGGFDYTETPTIQISGGNGTGAKAEVKMTKINHDIYFNASGISTSLGGFISTDSNIIGFNTEHKLNLGEEIIYNSFNNLKIGIGSTSGDVSTKEYLQDSASYYVSFVNDKSIKLHKNKEDAILGRDELNITTVGSGNQRFRSTRKKNIITSINVIDSGIGYENKKKIIGSVGINTANDTINIINHGFKSGELVTYNSTGSSVSGLDTSKQYYVIKIDDDKFRLAPISSGSTIVNQNYLTNQYARLKTKGDGIHEFNYPPISVSITGSIGVSRTDSSKYEAKIIPIFRGSITSIQVTDGGSGYGSTDVINFDRKPVINLNSGSDCVIKPVIKDSKIQSIVVLNRGKNYNSIPNFKFINSGTNAQLTPIIENGSIKSVEVVNGGVGFTTSSEIIVESSGKNAKISPNIKKWTVNLVEKYKDLFSQTKDDGLIISGIRSDLQYVNLFAPRKLRESTYSKNSDGSNNYNNLDLKFDSFEIVSRHHSPILGWSYDGCPIYGPYGYSNLTGGEIKCLTSGYQLLENSSRPTGYPLGFFVEDFVFSNNGDLDEHNGRFCKTPEYPNGIYAYFCSINSEENGYDTRYSNYRRPVFPYVIGNTFKYVPNAFNFNASSNQDNIELTSNLTTRSYIRNTYPYKLNDSNSIYEGIIEPQKIANQITTVDSASIGGVQSVGISSSGYNYRIGDRIIFDNTDTDGDGASAIVSELKESRIISIGSSIISIPNVTLTILSSNGLIQGVCTVPHGLKNLDTISISGISTDSFSKLSGSYGIEVIANQFSIPIGIETVGVTGITTFISIGTPINDLIKLNDVYTITSPGIGTEKLLVIGVDPVFNRIKVKREHDNTIGYAYSSFSLITEDPKTFRYNSGFSTSSTLKNRKKIYFTPIESVGLGTIGIGYTVNYQYGNGSKFKFIPIQTIYIKDHGLISGQKLKYSNEGNSSIIVSYGGTDSFPLPNESLVYAAKINDELIGISTLPIGIGSTGGFSGIGTNASILYFVSNGTGFFHSFETQEDLVTAKVEKNTADITCKQLHNLISGDIVNIEVIPGITTTVVVKYNSSNRRIVCNPKTFSGSGINTTTNSITIENHNYKTGDKVIYVSDNPAGGLIPNEIYYIVRIDKDSFRLTRSSYQTTISNPEFVGIGSTGLNHEISLVNPPLNMLEGSTLIFDLSDSSLADINNGVKLQSFEFDLYENKSFTNKFITTLKSPYFEVNKTGIVGVTDNASLSLKVTKDLPKNLYYTLIPLTGKTYLSKEKSEIIIDTDVINNNSLNYTTSEFNGNYIISPVGLGSTTFRINLKNFPENKLYNQENSLISYKTRSKTASGSISKIDILYEGKGYKSNPGISSILSTNGYGAILSAESTNIGRILKTTIQSVGFDYPFDSTLKPIAQLPQKLYVERLYSIGSVGLSSGGKNYTIPPKFIVIDGITGDIKTDVILESELSGNIVSKVNILKNTKTLFGLPKIIAINNNNGIGITNLTYNISNQIVTVDLASGFSTARDFPFTVGERIFVEGIGITSTGSGYNSSQYNYEFFTLVGVTSAIGGLNGSLSFKLDTNLDPGTFSAENSLQNGVNSYGRVIPEKYLPIFNPTLSLGEFSYNRGEDLFINDENVGTIVDWDPTFKLLKINNTNKSISPGTIVRGGNTDNRSIVVSSFEGYSDYTVGSTNQKLKDYSSDSGKLNTFLQVLQDGNYYQNFSYSLKSKVPIQTWNNSVKSLTHPLGLEKFSDLQVESETSQSDLAILSSNTDLLIDLIEEKDFDCYENFTFADEFTKTFNNSTVSEEIYFEFLKLLDYTEFRTNRVLEIDDISSQFDNTPNIFNYTVVGSFDVTKYNAAQFYLLIKDNRYFGEREIIIVDVIYDNSNGYLTVYGRNETVLDLGDFSFRRTGNNGEILFYPKKYQFNSYNISNLNINIANSGTSSIGTTSLGDIVSFASTAINITSSPTPSANTFVSISTSTYSSAKIIFSATNSNDLVQFGEINVVHNGTDAFYEVFAKLNSGTSAPIYENGNLGNIDVETSAGNVLVRFTPNPNTEVNIRALSILMGGTSNTGIGSTILYKSDLSSHYVSIASSTSPIETPIAGFTSSLNDAGHYYVQVHDLTNNRIQFSEVILINDSEFNPAVSEYAVITSDIQLGTIGAEKSTSSTNLTFTPLPNIDVQVRTYQKTLSILPKPNAKLNIDLDSAIIESDIENLFFEGTEISTKKEFNLTHRSSPIFKKIIDGSSPINVDIVSNTISIPNHFFVTGEKIDYSVSEIDVRIGIATTSVAGIGTTSLLPTTLYAVKLNDSLLQFADTPEKALKKFPEVLDINSVGIGASHVFSSNYKSNSKALVCVDNVIQSPIIPTSKTTSLSLDVDESNGFSFVNFDDVSGFYAKDLIKIDDEFMILYDIGIGATNRIYCRRERFGTVGVSHTAGAIVTKYSGNYNIVDDKIYFIDAPYGGDPNDSEKISSFQGRIFLRGQPVGSSVTAYYNNDIFDDISDKFNGIKDVFPLTSQGNNISGIVSSNSISAGILLINNIFQKPKYPATGIAQTYTYEVIESAGISSVLFSGNTVGLTTTGLTGPMKFDINTAGIPRGGIIVSVGSAQGYGFQPLVAAGGSAIVSAAGTIQSVSIANSGSGYRPGIQTSITVSVATSTGHFAIGTASALNGHIVSITVTNPGSGYTTTNPPNIMIDSPLNYENIPLVYTSSSNGIGTEAFANIVVGYGNSVIDFTITNSGYGYSTGDILTVPIGGTTGIPTDTALIYNPFEIYVTETFSDSFSAWYPGQFVVLDDFDSEFDGSRRTFKLKENGELQNFISARGSSLQLDQNILIFINDILQVPGESYKFEGGSQVEFFEPPKLGDDVKVLFFKGSDADVVEVEVEPTIKVGDKLTLVDKLNSPRDVYSQSPRVVSEVSFVDSVFTNSYFGPGITSESNINRTVEWCKQKEDFYIDEKFVSKSRKELNCNILPVTNLIRSVGIGSTVLFVQNTRTLFNYTPEILPSSKQILKIINQNEKLGAIATAVVSIAGTISEIIISNGGIGFSTSPLVFISAPNSGTIASATCTISGIGTVDTINIINPGSGYTFTNPPKVLIESEPVESETITNALYEGDFGIITGIGTTSISGVSTGIAFDFFIPKDSLLRDVNEVGSAVTMSGIQTGYYFVISQSLIGNGVTSLNNDLTVLGIGSTYIDNVYQAYKVENVVADALGIGNTNEILRVTTSVSSLNNLTGIGNSQLFGQFSWGRIYNIDRGSNPKSFNVDFSNGVSGLSTAPLIVRSTPMRSLYTS